nr:hypothetical protein [Tanacetum cinerariifolium]
MSRFTSTRTIDVNETATIITLVEEELAIPEESKPFEQEESEPEEQEEPKHEVRDLSDFSDTTSAFFSPDFGYLPHWGPSSADSYVTATRASDRYTCQGHMDQYMRTTEPRPAMVKSSHILLGNSVGYAFSLN